MPDEEKPQDQATQPEQAKPEKIDLSKVRPIKLTDELREGQSEKFNARIIVESDEHG
jgi:hypothetical protein